MDQKGAERPVEFSGALWGRATTVPGNWDGVLWPGKRYPRFERFTVEGATEGDAQASSWPKSVRRSSCRDYDQRTALPFRQWWKVVQSVMVQGVGEGRFFPVGSAGGIFGLESYVLCINVEDVRSGIYHILSTERAIEYLWPCPEGRLGQLFPTQAWTLNAHCFMVVSAVMEPYISRYGERGYCFAMMECGALCQEIVRASAGEGLGSCVLGGFGEDAVYELLDIRSLFGERVLCLVAFGVMA